MNYIMDKKVNLNYGNGDLVSVIIPLYNQKQYVEAAINSVLNQTYPYIEIIVVNDGSTDNPISVLKQFKSKVTIINQKNKGLGAARNVGLKNSSGKYIQFLDADDILAPKKISNQIQSFKANKNYSVFYCNCIRFSNNKKFQYHYTGKLTEPLSQFLNFNRLFPVPIHTALIKKKLFKTVGLFNENLIANEDREFWIRVALRGYSFGHIDSFDAYYRQHPRSMKRNLIHMCKSFINFNNQIEKILSENHALTPKIKNILANNYFYILKLMIDLKYKKKEQQKIIAKIKTYNKQFYPQNLGIIRKTCIKLFGLTGYIKLSNLLDKFRRSKK